METLPTAGATIENQTLDGFGWGLKTHTRIKGRCQSILKANPPNNRPSVSIAHCERVGIGVGGVGVGPINWPKPAAL